MNRTRQMMGWLATGLLGVGLLCGAALGAGVAPVPGSALPDAWGRAGGTVTLSVSEVEGKPVTISGAIAPSRGKQVTVRIPASTPPGRLRVQFVNDSTNKTITTRDVEVLAPETPNDPEARRVQLLIDPNLNETQAGDLLARLLLLPGIGTLYSRETLPAPISRSSPNTKAAQPAATSPCGGTLADIQLGAGITLEAALNLLAQEGGEDVWYPDPLTRWGAGALSQTLPAMSQSAQAQTQLPNLKAQVNQQSFHYVLAPVSPRVVLGSPAGGMTGAGVTIAVLDTGFSPQLDPTHELTDKQGIRLARVSPPINALVPFDPANPAPSLAGSQDFWEGHGTQVAILAAGALSGSAPAAGVLPIKVCLEGAGQASCSTKDVLRGLCVALSQVPAQQLVINLSLGGASPTGAIHAVLNWAQLQGAVVVAAGGNQHQASNPTDPEEYPAAFARSHAPSQAALPLLAVASTTPPTWSARSLVASALWPVSGFSTRGSYLNISAPGEALDLGHVQLYSGTSFAAPLVAGAAALARQANPNMTAAALRTYMLSSGRVIAGTSGNLSTSKVAVTGVAANQDALSQGLPMLRLSGY
ncbi:S8 family serine peptidase [Deinococcus detaillensis]|uniref:S8 family serine peptidase n=1 Tax=Deinococcus detaillensis TaxID=2592048 RepID=A0A553V4U2_9DEIO|nr:S8 family serine peptidase [Deinococcus detaillensis]TSA87503.1 S8 family serine peptidase [Deinococcus detaillensis]